MTEQGRSHESNVTAVGEKKRGQDTDGNVAEYHRFELTSSPYPPADYIKAVDEAYPGAAKIIFTQFELQMDHSRSMEARDFEQACIQTKDKLESEKGSLNKAQNFVLLLILVAIAVGAAAVFAGHDTAGCVLAGLVLAFCGVASFLGYQSKKNIDIAGANFSDDPVKSEESELPKKNNSPSKRPPSGAIKELK